MLLIIEYDFDKIDWVLVCRSNLKTASPASPRPADAVCEPVWPAVRRSPGQQKDLDSIPLRLSFLLKKVVICRHCHNVTINQTLKWLSSLPIVMQESFCW